MVHSLCKAAAIVGVDESDQIGKLPDKSSLQLAAEAAVNALADAGIHKSEVDGIAAAEVYTTVIAEYLGITPRYTDGTTVGGSSYEIHVAHAVEAIASGRTNVVLVVHGEGHPKGRFQDPRPRGFPSSIQQGEYEFPYGIAGAPTVYGMACMRHMAQYGTTKEQLASIAVQTREWAMMNPKAMMHTRITVEDVLASKMISYPFNLLDCCLVTDAGGACVIVSPERARDLRKKPVWVLGVGESHDHFLVSQMPDLTRTTARYSGADAFAMAGVGHDDIDFLEVYDSFTYTVLATLESLGFCGPGEGGPFVSEGRLGPGGSLPTNTSGGGLSYTHPGKFGVFLIIEAVRQLRGECGDRQVPGATLGLVNGTGGNLASTGTLILGVD